VSSRPSLFFAALLSASPAWAGVSLSLGEIRHPAFAVDGLEIAFDTGRKGAAEIRIERLAVAGVEYRALSIRCADFVLDARRLDCPRGEVRRADSRSGDRPALPFSFSYRFREGALELAVAGTEALAWSPLIKRLRSWNPSGTVDLKLAADRRQAHLSLAVHQLRFANRAGDAAGDGIDVSLDATARRTTQGWLWSATIDWPAGELYLAPWYRKAGVQASAQGALTEQALAVDLARLDLAGIGGVTASLRWDRPSGQISDWGFVTEQLDLATVVREWVQPWLDQSAVPKLKASGFVRFSAAASAGRLQSFYAGLEEASLVDGTGHLEFQGMNARVPWERGVASEAEFSVAAGRLGDFPLGGFRIPVTLRDNRASLENLSMPMLDGQLSIAELSAVNTDTGWRGRFAGGIEGLSMPKVSAALKLPGMAGKLTVRVPEAGFENNVLSLGGDLVIEVFDGRVVASGLQVLDPLRPGQRFVANVRARNLDLGLLTSTFSFGSILGRLDADITGLELQGWQPVRFDARIASSPGEYRRSISRGALQDISALGGAAGAAAVRASPAGFFNSFDYERIGLGCALRDGVCHLSGLEPVGEGYRLIQGRGMPRVQVIGYNRRVDWNLLLSRIRAVIAGKSKAVIE
jgi:hypothetical protein